MSEHFCVDGGREIDGELIGENIMMYLVFFEKVGGYPFFFWKNNPIFSHACFFVFMFFMNF